MQGEHYAELAASERGKGKVFASSGHRCHHLPTILLRVEDLKRAHRAPGAAQLPRRPASAMATAARAAPLAGL